VYPKGGSGEGGPPTVPLERMLRIYLLQLWFNFINQRYRYNDQIDERQRRKKRTRPKIRSRVGRAFRIVKHQ
jgi:hypothetical protein